MRQRRVEHCSFCGFHKKEVGRLFDAPGFVAICDQCVERMHGMISTPRREPIRFAEFKKRLKETKP